MTVLRLQQLPPAWALVPAKSLSHAKSRLAPLLAQPQRRSLQCAMLSDVLAALSGASLIEGIVVVTSDPDIGRIAAGAGAVVLGEEYPDAGLNRAMIRGRDWLAARECAWAVAVPADLPFLESAEIDAAIMLARKADVTVVLPNRDGSGTNGMVFRPAAAPDFVFGADSFRRHVRQSPSGRATAAVSLPSFALDVDTPADLAEAFSRWEASVGDAGGAQMRNWMLGHRQQLEEHRYG
jgi:2-phospho-L-lactate guanylyltransferase